MTAERVTLARAESHVTRGYTLALVATVIWSTTGPIIAALLANSSLAPLTLAAWRDLLTAAILAAVLAWRAPHLLRLPRDHWPFFLAYGVALAFMNAAWTVSVQRNGAAVSTVLVYMSPAFVALGARWLLKEHLSRAVAVALPLSLAGVALVAGLYDPALLARDSLGTAVGIGAGLLNASYSLFGRAAAKRRLHPATSLVYSFAIAGGLLFLAQVNTGVPDIEPAIWLGLLALVIPTLGGYGLFTASLAYLPPATASLITCLEPALTALLAWVALGETLSPPQLIGGALIVGGVVVLALGERFAT